MALEASPSLLWVSRAGQSPSEDKAEEHPQNRASPLSFVVVFPALGQPCKPFWLLCPLGRSLHGAGGCPGHGDPIPDHVPLQPELLQPPEPWQFL